MDIPRVPARNTAELPRSASQVKQDNPEKQAGAGASPVEIYSPAGGPFGCIKLLKHREAKGEMREQD